jgi:hypothetical protein
VKPLAVAEAVEMDEEALQQQTLVEAVVEVVEAGIIHLEALVLLILVVVVVEILMKEPQE